MQERIVMNEENKKPETKIEAGELSLNEWDNVAVGSDVAGAAAGLAAGTPGNTNPPAVGYHRPPPFRV
jgi:hypothetical protein